MADLLNSKNGIDLYQGDVLTIVNEISYPKAMGNRLYPV